MIFLNMKTNTSSSLYLKNKENKKKVKMRRYINLTKKKIEVDSDKS